MSFRSAVTRKTKDNNKYTKATAEHKFQSEAANISMGGRSLKLVAGDLERMPGFRHEKV